MRDRPDPAVTGFVRRFRCDWAACKGLVRYVNSGVYSDIFSARAVVGRQDTTESCKGLRAVVGRQDTSEECKRPTACKGRKEVILRLSYYRQGLLMSIVRALLRGQARTASRILARDAVTICNLMGRVGNAFITRNISPHFVYFYGATDCKNFAAELAKDITHADPFVKRVRKLRRKKTLLQLAYNNVSFHERFDTDLTMFLEEYDVSEYVLMSILFQVLYTLAALQRHLPGFRHNDLSTNNVFVKVFRGRGERWCSEYVVDGRRFWVRLPDLNVAVCDWDFAHAAGPHLLAGFEDLDLKNERVVSRKYGVTTKDNPAYDAHYFLATFLRCIKDKSKRYPLTVRFLKSQLGAPRKDRVDQVMRHLRPFTLLRHSFFDGLLDRPDVPVAHVYRFQEGLDARHEPEEAPEETDDSSEYTTDTGSGGYEDEDEYASTPESEPLTTIRTLLTPPRAAKRASGRSTATRR